MRTHKGGKLFGKGFAWATRIVAEEATYLNDETHRAATNRQIVRVALVAAVDALGCLPTRWASSREQLRTEGHAQSIFGNNLFNTQVDSIWKQNQMGKVHP